MKTALVLGVVALSLMSFNLTNDPAKNCVEYAERIEDYMTNGECSTDIYNMAYSYCMKNLNGMNR